MDTRRLIVLLLAAGAAGVVALMVRGLIGGGTKEADAKANPPPVAMTEVLVANERLDPGLSLNDAKVRWQSWPSKNIDGSFIVRNAAATAATAASAVNGTVVRAPMVSGEPVTYAKIVRSGGAGFMAATLAPGMRAMSISISVASVAGGFILPNDRVDIILTMLTGDNPKRGSTRLVLSDVRVLAIDQASDAKDQKAVADVKTVTLELTPQQVQTVSLAQAMGVLSLSLRSLGDNQAVAANTDGKDAAKAGQDDGADSGIVSVLRYGMTRKLGGGGGQ
jgi:pilus assembly protein CpaB